MLVCLEMKGIDCGIDPIAPSAGNQASARLSPLKPVPVLIDDAPALTDSSVIRQ